MDRVWTVADIGTLAISSVADASFKRDSHLPPTALKKLKASDFEAYLASIRGVYTDHLRIKTQGASATQGTLATQDPSQSFSALRSKRRGTVVQTPSIHPLLMDPAFDPANPFTFAQLSDNLNLTDMSKYGPLLEKLAMYLDGIESCLVTEISRRSMSFFSALESWQILHQETTECIQTLEQLRKHIEALSENTVANGLTLIRLNQRRHNLSIFHTACKLIADVNHTIPTIQQLLGQNDVISALDMVEETVSAMKNVQLASALIQNPNSALPRQLSSTDIVCLAGFSTQLRTFASQIRTNVETELTNLCIAYIEKYLSDESILEQSHYQFISPPELSIHKLTDALYPLVVALIRMDRFIPLMQVYKERLIHKLKELSRQEYAKFFVLPETSNDSASKKERQQHFDQALKAMNLDTYQSFLRHFFKITAKFLFLAKIVGESIQIAINLAQQKGVTMSSSIVEILKEVRTDGAIMLEDEDDMEDPLAMSHDTDILSASMSSAPGTLAPLEEVKSSIHLQLQSEVMNALFGTTNFVHARCAKLLVSRSDSNAQLNPKDFYVFNQLVTEYIKAGEKNCGRTVVSLKSVLSNQTKHYLRTFHDERTKQLASLIENEQWMQCEVPQDFQLLVNQIIMISGNSQSNELSENALDTPRGSRYVSQESVEDPQSAASESSYDLSSFAAFQSQTSSPLKNQENKNAKMMEVDGRKFFVVGCTLMFTKVLVEYLRCVTHVPFMITETLSKIFDVLKLYNSRVCQVILGAGAMRSAGLKNISARHIALASQSLGIIIMLIPHIKNIVQKGLPAKQYVLLAEFDRLLRDYREHQNELHVKIESIMMERFASHIEQFRQIKWDQPEPQDFSTDTNVSKCTESLVKETETLFKVISKFFEPETLRQIMNPILKKYTQALDEDVMKVEIYTSGGKNRLLMDVQFYIERFSAFPGIDGPGNQLEVSVNNVRIRVRPKTPIPPAKRP